MTDPLQISIVRTIDVDAVWPQIVEGMQKACDVCEGETAGSLWQACRSGQSFLIAAHDTKTIYMASVWRFEVVEGTPSLRCVMLSGREMRRWIGPAREFIERMASQNGAKRIVALGRPGWSRIFREAGRSGPYHVLELKNGRNDTDDDGDERAA